ncbi:hypothetical protein BDV96DRAFT_581854 [Lophiotrema nucula]|uniref:Heterokaryon incompatibility domain-containing protein n=1 Tax=Lophiotrema nucula TaxID=690887 RepID=A0A6A5YX98_9PLEO|nr:hypothetical protein BDV96DRAFT_581854 [Lophiotrema nucula]
MEHLLSQEFSSDLANSIEPAIWLGFNHDRWLNRPPVESLEGYAGQSVASDLMLAKLENNLQGCSISEIAFLQSLLAIGIWEVLLRRKLPTRLFLIGFCPGATFSTRSVIPLLSGLRRLGNQQPNSHDSRIEHKDLLLVIKFLSRWDGVLVSTNIPQFCHIIPKLRRQAALMYEAIYDVALHHTRRVDHLEQGFFFFHTGVFSDLRRERLQRNGFCPSKFGILEYMGLSSLEYFLVTGINGLGSSIAAHESCNCQRCYHQTYGDIHSRVCHVKLASLGGCNFVAASSSIIKRAIVSGTYFVLDVSRIVSTSDIPDDAIIPYSPGLPYVALSHVWAHGLASDADTGLPFCQLQRLLQLLLRANSVTGLRTTNLWIDSLCIPREPELKMRSIAMMEQIYKNATVVIALDAFLETIDYKQQSLETCALYIITSDWNQRLWTFQEAKLAKRLGFLFKDGVKMLEKIHNDLRDRVQIGQSTAVTSQSLQWLGLLSLRSMDFFSWVQMFQFKSCSVVDDEALVISNLLGLNTSCLTTVEGPKRMAELWIMLSVIPKGLLFYSGPRLQIEPFRWAASSFLSGSSELGLGKDSNDTAHVTRNGLRGRYKVVDLHRTLQEDSGHFSLMLGRFAIHFYPRKESALDSLSLPFNAVALIRYPAQHWNSIPKTPISAVTLLKTDHRSGIPVYRHQYQVLGRLQPMIRSTIFVLEEKEILIY